MSDDKIVPFRPNNVVKLGPKDPQTNPDFEFNKRLGRTVQKFLEDLHSQGLLNREFSFETSVSRIPGSRIRINYEPPIKDDGDDDLPPAG